MKKSLLMLAGAFMAFTSMAQQRNIMQIHRVDGTTEERYVDEIDRITFHAEGEAPPQDTEAIDMGLSVKWANCNVDASRPEQSGGFYAWGETETKDVYNNTTYKYYNLEWQTIQRIGTDISGTQYDVARRKLGGEWRMPTHEEWQELVLNCDWQWTSRNGVNGYLVTADNGNSIFLPAAGRLYHDGSANANGYENLGGFYWTSTLAEDDGVNYLAYRMNFGDTWYGQSASYDAPELGFTIRPVQGSLSDVDPEPEPGPMDMVDLGLNVKWASHNVMAAKASEPGYYYAWGVTKKQSMYGDGAYKYKDVETGEFENLGEDISGTKYDVAHVRWGNGWRLPTKADFEELLEKCTFVWGMKEGKNGYTVTGPNGNSIFLPVCGYMGTEGLMCADPYDNMGLPLTSHYMSANPKPRSSQPNSVEHSAYTLRITKQQKGEPSIKCDDTFKSIGISVRPVHD